MKGNFIKRKTKAEINIKNNNDVIPGKRLVLFALNKKNNYQNNKYLKKDNYSPSLKSKIIYNSYNPNKNMESPIKKVKIIKLKHNHLLNYGYLKNKYICNIRTTYNSTKISPEKDKFSINQNNKNMNTILYNNKPLTITYLDSKKQLNNIKNRIINYYNTINHSFIDKNNDKIFNKLYEKKNKLLNSNKIKYIKIDVNKKKNNSINFIKEYKNKCQEIEINLRIKKNLKKQKSENNINNYTNNINLKNNIKKNTNIKKLNLYNKYNKYNIQQNSKNKNIKKICLTSNKEKNQTNIENNRIINNNIDIKNNINLKKNICTKKIMNKIPKIFYIDINNIKKNNIEDYKIQEYSGNNSIKIIRSHNKIINDYKSRTERNRNSNDNLIESESLDIYKNNISLAINSTSKISDNNLTNNINNNISNNIINKESNLNFNIDKSVLGNNNSIIEITEKIFPDGKYKGIIINGKREINGIMIYNSGSKYEGQWKDNKKHGKGIYYSYNKNNNIGIKYEGEFNNDKFEGKGIAIYSNGDIYNGEWKNNKQYGKGIVIYKTGGRYEGEWEGGKFNGLGKYFLSNGERFEGRFSDSKFNGYGKYYFNNSDILEGFFRDEKPIGQCILYKSDGTVEIKRFI